MRYLHTPDTKLNATYFNSIRPIYRPYYLTPEIEVYGTFQPTITNVFTPAYLSAEELRTGPFFAKLVMLWSSDGGYTSWVDNLELKMFYLPGEGAQGPQSSNIVPSIPTSLPISSSSTALSSSLSSPMSANTESTQPGSTLVRTSAIEPQTPLPSTSGTRPNDETNSRSPTLLETGVPISA